MGAIVLPGLASNDPVPGVYIETNFAQGDVTGSDAQRPILVLANKTSAGSAVVDTKIYGPDTDPPLQTETDMIALGGAGSEAHRMYRQIAKVNKDTAVYWVFVTASGGTAATGTVTIATNASGNGVHRLWVGDESVETAIATGDTPTVIATAMKANINAKTHWPVTADNVAGVLTLTAKTAGPRGNWIRFQAQITSGIATTTTATTDAFLTSGATADSNTAALATIAPRRFYYIVSAAEDATQFGALISQVNTQASPITGIRQRAFAGSVASLAATTTIATGINAARAEIVWSESSPLTPAELAANAAAVYALFEVAPNPRTNFAGFGNDAVSSNYWKVPRSRLDSAVPSRTSIKSALNNGITPIGVNPNGTTYIVNRITSRSLSGLIPDYRIRDAHKVTICDFFADDVAAVLALYGAGKRIANNPPKGARVPGSNVATPNAVRGRVVGVIDSYDANDLLQNVAQIKAATVVQRETSPTTRMSVRVPLQPVDNLLSMAVAVDQVA